MTNIRSSGFTSKQDLQRHLAELEDEAPAEDPRDERARSEDLDAALREIAWLRKEVMDLREQWTNIGGRTEELPSHGRDYPWLRIVLLVATTIALGKLVERLRLGAAGAAAVPMITGQLERQLR